MGTACFFVADLHGHFDRYEKLFYAIRQQQPDAVFIGGDIMPGININEADTGDFICDYLRSHLKQLKKELKHHYPRIFVIMGNDDPKSEEQNIKTLEKEGLWEYVHFKKVYLSGYNIYGYAYIPPTPFMLKDWEKYDVSVFVDPGCVHPTEGARTVEPIEDIAFTNINKDLEKITEKEDMGNAVFLFHSPPYNTYLDRAALDGKMVDYVPLDVHVGSIAIQRFIEDKQPYLTMHGHVHEASSITGMWMQKIKKTVACSAAYDGTELALVTFVLEDLSTLKREII
ncbi:MAG: hypothetical protein U9Q98_08980 [Bacteroidota bacterium]|nr:hypothetical protein [Bacteroidota bacterium]